MNHQELAGDFRRINNRIKAIERASAADDAQEELISLSSSFLCVDICGRLEQNLKSMFSTFGSRKSDRVLDKSISKLVSYYQNPKPKNLLELIDLFDTELSVWLSEKWKENEEHEVAKKRLENLVDDRITLAHSKKTSHNISITKLKNYFSEYTEIVAFLNFYFLGIKVFEKNKYLTSRTADGLQTQYH